MAERLTAKLPISGQAVATFVGHGGSAIRKLRRLCVGCSVDLSPVGAEGFAEVLLMAEAEAKLGAAKGLVEKWIRQQQVHVGCVSYRRCLGCLVVLADLWVVSGLSA